MRPKKLVPFLDSPVRMCKYALIKEKLKLQVMALKQFHSNLLFSNSAKLLLWGIGLLASVHLNTVLPNFFKSSYTSSFAEAKPRIPHTYKHAFQRQWKQPGAKDAHQENNGTKQDSVLLKFEQSLLPVPQQVSFSGQPFSLKETWHLVLGSAITTGDPAVQSLLEGLQHCSNLKLTFAQTPVNKNTLPAIHLSVKAGAVPIGPATDTARMALAQQAYHLKLAPGNIEITANAPAGLFYGVQTLLQLIQSQKEPVYLPQGDIQDWPDMEVRLIYWDDAHHLEHLDALKRAIRQAACFKINAFSLKLEGHFQFQTAKPIVEPYAMTAAEYRELAQYAKAHYVELVPYLDAPAHVSFILKHPEYARLRAFPNSNYEFSVMQPGTDSLLLGLFDELVEASKGGKYVLFSTDEGYYVGKAADDQKEAQALGGVGKLYAMFIARIANQLHQRGRKVIFWGEYPLTPSDVTTLPPHLINGVYSSDFAAAFKQHGMRQMIYTYIQGEEPLFPSYAPQASGDVKQDEAHDRALGRVQGVLKTVTDAVSEQKADLMGVIVAGWSDAGLHPETFWLGYAAGAATGWKHRSITAKDLTERFYAAFYGAGTIAMDTVYQLLSRQAQFWEESWAWMPSPWRTPIFGNSEGVYETPKPALDQTLPLLPVPSENLSLPYHWSDSNRKRLPVVQGFLKDNRKLITLLHQNVRSVQNKRYNLEVLLSVAQLCKQNLDLLLGLQQIDTLLQLSSKIAATDPTVAVALLDQALDAAEILRQQRNEALQSLITIWYKDWYPRMAEANGRRYLDSVDDVKDHEPGRTVDMSYLIYRDLHYPLGTWAENVRKVRNQFAAKNGLPDRKEIIQWASLD